MPKHVPWLHHPDLGGADTPRPTPLHFWNGTEWEKLHTDLSNPIGDYGDGYRQALTDMTIMCVDHLDFDPPTRNYVYGTIKGLRCLLDGHRDDWLFPVS